MIKALITMLSAMEIVMLMLSSAGVSALIQIFPFLDPILQKAFDIFLQLMGVLPK